MILKTRLHSPKQVIYQRNIILGDNRWYGWLVYGLGCGCVASLIIGKGPFSKIFAVYLVSAIIFYVILWWITKTVTIERAVTPLSERYYEFDDEFITTYGSLGHYKRMKLRSIKKVVRTSQGYELFLGEIISNTLPVEAFENEHDRQAFEALIDKQHLFAPHVVSENEVHLLKQKP